MILHNVQILDGIVNVLVLEHYLILIFNNGLIHRKSKRNLENHQDEQFLPIRELKYQKISGFE